MEALSSETANYTISIPDRPIGRGINNQNGRLACMMPNKTQLAVDWAFVQGAQDPHGIVNAVRMYFNDHEIE